jgi:hypothetical protein
MLEQDCTIPPSYSRSPQLFLLFAVVPASAHLGLTTTSLSKLQDLEAKHNELVAVLAGSQTRLQWRAIGRCHCFVASSPQCTCR